MNERYKQQCDKKCTQAKNEKCVCICGGKNHGRQKGLFDENKEKERLIKEKEIE